MTTTIRYYLLNFVSKNNTYVFLVLYTILFQRDNSLINILKACLLSLGNVSLSNPS
jgi:hypothetical protein